jgi:hypothetical protein
MSDSDTLATDDKLETKSLVMKHDVPCSSNVRVPGSQLHKKRDLFAFLMMMMMNPKLRFMVDLPEMLKHLYMFQMLPRALMQIMKVLIMPSREFQPASLPGKCLPNGPI